MGKIIKPTFEETVQINAEKISNTGILDAFGRPIHSDNSGYSIIVPTLNGAEKRYIGLHEDGITSDNYKPNSFLQAVTGIGKIIIPFAAAAGIVGLINSSLSNAEDLQNPQSLVPTNPQFIKYIDNPFPQFGNITGLDDINGDSLLVGWSDGHVGIYTPDMGELLSIFNTMALSSTGVTFIPAGYRMGNSIVVTDDVSAYFYNTLGNQLMYQKPDGTEGQYLAILGTSGITDTEFYFGENNAGLKISDVDGIHNVDWYGSLSGLKGSGTSSFEMIDMNNPYADLFFQNRGVNVLDQNGNWDSSIMAKSTNYNNGDIMEAMAFTKDFGYTSHGEYLSQWGPADFQNPDNMNYTPNVVPDASAMITFAVFAPIMIGLAKKFRAKD